MDAAGLAARTLREHSLKQAVGRGYGDFWRFEGRYRVCKGGRASKKSRTTALNLIVRLMRYAQANLLVVRKVYRTLRDSCFAELRWAIGRLGVEAFWAFREQPLEMTYLPTGQKIFFRGLDDPQKVASITVQAGCLCWLWLEEAFELEREADFDLVDESIRGWVPEGLFKQATITFNPWNETHWLKKRFFDPQPSTQLLAKTTCYLCNEFLDADDHLLFERMRTENPRRYRVAGLGEWGVCEGLIYAGWQVRAFDAQALLSGRDVRAVFGLDFGYASDPCALFCGALDLEKRQLFVFDELYERGLSNRALFERVCDMGYRKERIVADSAEPKSIDELRGLGLSRLIGARKGPDSIRSGIRFLQEFEMIVHPKCTNFLTEVGGYAWASDGQGHLLGQPGAAQNHLMDAMRYAVEGVQRGDVFSF